MVPLESRENSGLGLPYEEYSGSGSVNWVPEIYDEGGLLECNNGSVRKIFKYCSCEPNFTGKYCETELFQNTHQEASTLTLDYSGSGSGAGICFHGIPVFIKRCECHFGYTGISCERRMTYGSGEENNVLTEEPRNKSVVNRLNSTEDITWSASAFDELTWNPITKHLNPNRNLAAFRHIFEEKFIVISTGIRRTKTKLDYFNPVNSHEPTIYRFSFVPKPSGGKSRLELNTCFVEKRNSQQIFGTQEIDDLIRSTLITQCPVAKMPITALHTYTYELYLPRADFNDEGKYLLTQWHGSPNPNILKDEYGCVAELSLYDKGRLCGTGSCTQGEIFDRDGQHIGLLYQQGGYPPLAFEYI
uniref:EGF-like domain-containing protein n=1 Tax=Ciona savignyi TaxID=51511 RepID=H2ZIW5_CIOSA